MNTTQNPAEAAHLRRVHFLLYPHAGRAHNQPRRNQHLPWRGFLRNLLKEQLRRLPALHGGVDIHRRQRRIQILRQWGVVEGRNADILRHAQAPVARGAQQALVPSL